MWGKNVFGKLEFFLSGMFQRKMELFVVSLFGVDDFYFFQRKFMMMLKYMYDNYIDNFEWFMWFDDDVYIWIEKLVSFFYFLNSL